MLTDLTEGQYNPVLGVLERHDALQLLIDPEIKLFPQFIGLCDFQQEGFRYKGKFVSENRDIEIEYDTFPGNNQELLFCNATAPLELWNTWQEDFPEDFIKAILCNSPYFQINPKLLVSSQQQLTFYPSGVNNYLTYFTEIQLGDEHISIHKDIGRHVIVDSDKHILRSLFHRGYF